MSDELKPCPFCGGEAAVTKVNLEPWDKDWVFYGVHCLNDYLYDVSQHGHFIGGYKTEAEAIAAWNTRANDNLQPESVISDPDGGSNVAYIASDSREKLEEDAFEFASYLLYANYDGVDDIPINAEEKREMRELLDRQAAITKRECMTAAGLVATESPTLQAKVDSLTTELRECDENRIEFKAQRDFLQQRVDGLTAKLDKANESGGKLFDKLIDMTAERDELRDIIDHMPKTEQECEACQEAHDRLMFNAKVHQDELRDELKHKQLVIDTQRDSFLKLEAENAELRKMLADAAEAI